MLAAVAVVVAAALVLTRNDSVDSGAQPSVALADRTASTETPAINAPTGDAGRADDAIACTLLSPSGELEGRLSLYRPDGSTVREFALPIAAPFDLRTYGDSAPSVMLRNPIDGHALLFDLRTGDTQDLPDLALSSPRSESVQLGNDVSDEQWSTWILDFSEGTATDISGVIAAEEQSRPPRWVDTDPRLRNMLIRADSGLWLLPIDDLVSGRNLADAHSGTLSRTSDEVVYVVDGIAWRQSVDGGPQERLASNVREVSHLADGLLIVRDDGISYLARGSEIELHAAERTILSATVLPNRDHSAAVVYTTNLEEPRNEMLWVDPTQESIHLLPGDMRPIGQTFDHLVIGGRSPGFDGRPDLLDQASIVELRTGATVQIAVPTEGIMPFLGDTTDAGHAIVFGPGQTTSLVDLDTGELSQFGILLGTPQFSPDGSELVFTRWNGEDRTSISTVIAPVNDPQDTRSLGRCQGAVWVVMPDH